MRVRNLSEEVRGSMEGFIQGLSMGIQRGMTAAWLTNLPCISTFGDGKQPGRAEGRRGKCGNMLILYRQLFSKVL